MLFIDKNTSRTDLEEMIIADKDLYQQFDETKFLNEEYTTEELMAIVTKWIEDGDECSAS